MSRHTRIACCQTLLEDRGRGESTECRYFACLLRFNVAVIAFVVAHRGDGGDVTLLDALLLERSFGSWFTNICAAAKTEKSAFRDRRGERIAVSKGGLGRIIASRDCLSVCVVALGDNLINDLFLEDIIRQSKSRRCEIEVAISCRVVGGFVVIDVVTPTRWGSVCWCGNTF